MSTLTHRVLLGLLHYEPGSGAFVWKVRPSIGTPEGAVAGTTLTQGYRSIRIKRAGYRAHRLAFFYMMGRWPLDQIDHIDGDRANNCWANLREASRSQNGANRGAPNKNSSGHKGVQWNAKLGKWQVAISAKGKKIHLGVFDDVDRARAAYLMAAHQHFGEFARQ